MIDPHFSEWRKDMREWYINKHRVAGMINIHILATTEQRYLNRDVSYLELIEEAVYRNKYLPIDKMGEHAVHYYNNLYEREENRRLYEQ